VNGDKLKVLFVCSKPDFRCHKMAKGLLATGECEPLLIASGWDPVLHGPAFKSASILGGAFNSSFFIYRMLDISSNGRADLPAKPLLKLWLGGRMRDMEPYDVLHTMTPPVTMSKLAIECTSAPVVFDQYDLILQSYGKDHQWPREIADERWCFEHAQGFVHKGPRSEIDFYRGLGYKLDGPELTYPDGCDEGLFQPTGQPKLRDKDGEWHVVYVGGIHGPDKPYYLLKEFEKMAAQGIHSHIYPAPWSVEHEDLGVYEKSEAGKGRIHMHGTLPYAQLVRELTRYDYGLFYFDIDPAKWPALARKNKTAAGNKMPTYYEAGLPVIVGGMMDYSAGFVREAGTGLVVNPGDIAGLKGALDSASYENFVSAVSGERQRLSIASQAKRLLGFYRSMLDKNI
jgi:glycosyltransferase involved in cell wall biosynthesis